jgi:hypothetical protein
MEFGLQTFQLPLAPNLPPGIILFRTHPNETFFMQLTEHSDGTVPHTARSPTMVITALH